MFGQKDTHTIGSDTDGAIALLFVLRALRVENHEWYTQLCARINVQGYTSEHNYFFSYDDLRGKTVLGLVVVDHPHVRRVAQLLMLNDAVFFGHNGDPVNVHTFDEFLDILKSRPKENLVWHPSDD